MITVRNETVPRQVGYIIAPDLSPKSQNYRGRREEVEKRERWRCGDGVEITSEAEGRNPSSKSLN